MFSRSHSEGLPPPTPRYPRWAGASAVAVALLGGSLGPAGAVAADDESPQIKAAIAKGVEFLRKNVGNDRGGRQVLSALAMVKGGADKKDPLVQKTLAAIRARTKGGKYKPDRDELYTAGLELMLLEAAGDPETDRETMRPILGYILATQQQYGSWYYVSQAEKNPNAFFGDTSITQYAVLGLWSAERSGLPPDPAIWNGVAKWQMATRRRGDTFAYHPTREGGGDVRDTMTAAGACNALLCARFLHGADADAQRQRAAAEERAAEEAKDALLKKYAAFDRRLSPEDEERERQSKAAGGVVPLSTLTATADGAIASLARGMQYTNGANRLYLLYSVERLGALSGRRLFGDRDWYAEGSAFLLKTQKADGSWDGQDTSGVGTAFAVMFLAKATAKALGSPRSLYGGGMLKGGRGLPDDFTKARFDGEEITFDRPTGDLADLLSSLEDPGAANVPAARDAVLETVRTGDREALIGQTARLRRLVDDPRPDVRAVVMWALARGGGGEDVEAIFKRLAEDPDVAVVREAHNALCVLSRLPRGPGVPLAMPREEEAALERLEERDLPPTYVVNDRLRVLPGGPFEGLPAGLNEEERVAAFRDWRSVAVRAWAAWRDAVRPYDQRDHVPAPKRP